MMNKNFTLFLFFISISLSLYGKVIDLIQFDKKIYSQSGEDGIIEKIFNQIGTTNKFYVEFGTEAGTECNTRYLREGYEWSGLLMDGNHENKYLNLHKEFITAENINSLFEKHDVPSEFDMLSIDIDFNDWYVWYALSPKYKPRVVVIEYNGTHLPHEDRIVEYNSAGQWDGSNYHGASILALYNLGTFKGYSLVSTNKLGVNLFFIRNDIIEECSAKGVEFFNINNVEALYTKPSYSYGPNGGHPQDPYFRPYVESTSILKPI